MNEDDDKTRLVSTPAPGGVPLAAEGPAAKPLVIYETGGNALPIGFQLSEFRLERVIGEGGFGIVYLAHDHHLDRRVAVKEYMPSALAARGGDLSIAVKSERYRETFDAGMRSFINEARLLAQFDHPALLKVYRFWEERGTAYMVMPYYEGPTLKEWKRGHAAPPPEAWLRTLLAALLDALELLHARSCYHRDIAPDNILLLANGAPLLLDFGAARRIIGDMTQALTVILKPGYAPVEQYAEVSTMKQGPWTDIYALSAVMYYLISGRPPPPSVGRMMTDDMTRLSALALGHYTPALLAAIDVGLSVRPEDRPQTIAAFRQLLFGSDAAADDERTVVQPLRGGEAALLGAGVGVGAARAPSVGGVRSGGSLANEWAGSERAGDESTGSERAGNERAGNRKPRASIGNGASVAANASAATVHQVARNESTRWWLLGAAAAAVAAIAIALALWLGSDESNGRAAQGDAADATGASSGTAGPAGTTTRVEPTASGGTGAPTSPARSPAALLREVYTARDTQIAVEAKPSQRTLEINRDRFQFTVRSSLSGYVYVLLAGTNEQHLWLLFPNANDKNNRIEANSELKLPRPSWTLGAGGPPGIDRVLVLVSQYPRDFSISGLNYDDGVAEFSLDRLPDALSVHGLAALAGRAQCPSSAPCADRFGAAMFEVEEVEGRR
jgi:hypothetical protein